MMGNTCWIACTRSETATSLIPSVISSQLSHVYKTRSMKCNTDLTSDEQSPKGQSPCLCKGLGLVPSVQNYSRLTTTLNQHDQWGMAPIHLACELGHTDLVHILLHFGAQPNLRTLVNHGKTTPLVIASSGGHADCVRLLLQFGAEVNETDCWGNTALYKAACYNFVECVKVLLENGANPNKVNKWGALPLQYASLQGYDDVVRLLLDFKADVQMWGEITESQALTAAVTRGHFSCIELLLKAGTPPNIPGNCYGHTPIDALVYYNCDHVDCLKLLLRYGATVTPKTVLLLCDSNNLGFISKCKTVFLETILQAIPSATGFEAELMKTFILLTEASCTLHADTFPFLKLILNLGLRLPQDDIRAIQDNPRTTLSMSEVIQLKQLAASPSKLTELCRNKIRTTLRSPMQINTDQLPVPISVKDYIKFVYC